MTNPDDREQRQEPAQGASSKACGEGQTFHIEAVNLETGRRVRMTGFPMVRRACEIMAGKITAYSWRRLELVEAAA